MTGEFSTARGASGTVMRHFLRTRVFTAPAAVAALALGVTVPAASRVLIPASRRAQRFTPGEAAAACPAVLLAPITARADEHLAPASGTEKQSGIVHRSPRRGELDDPRLPGNTALGAVRKCGSGRSLGCDRQVSTVRGCVSLLAESDLTPTHERRHRRCARCACAMGRQHRLRRETTTRPKRARRDDSEQIEWQDHEDDLHSMSASDLLLGSTFQLSSGGEQGSGSVWTAWGQFATGGFETEVDDTQMDGNVTSGFIGADVSGDRWLGGLALSVSKGDGDFSLMNDEDTGEIESTLTSVYPYARIGVSDKVDLWGMVGAGEGEVTLMQHADSNRTENQSIKTDIGMRMGAIGIRGEVLSPEEAGGVSIAVTSDAFLVKMTSDEREDCGLADVEPGAAQHPELDRHIEYEDLLERGARLDLDQAPAACGKTFYHVGANQHPLVLEGRFEYRGGRIRLDDLARCFERVSDVAVIVFDELAAGNSPARHLADLVSGIDDRLKGIVGRDREFARVAVVPEPQMALGSGEVVRFRERGLAGHESWSTCLSRACVETAGRLVRCNRAAP